MRRKKIEEGRASLNDVIERLRKARWSVPKRFSIESIREDRGAH